MKQNKMLAPFRRIRNLFLDIRFWWNEIKLQEKEDKEIEEVEFSSKHGSMQGFMLYKKYEAARAERKRLHELKKKM